MALSRFKPLNNIYWFLTEKYKKKSGEEGCSPSVYAFVGLKITFELPFCTIKFFFSGGL